MQSPTKQPVDWDIFRFIVAVADHGSAVAAARVLGVDASTVQRRIIRFERDHGVTLFERQRSGYTPTAQCQAVLDTARGMQAGVSDTIRTISGRDLRLEGRVTVTTNETLAEAAIAPLLASFRAEHPAIEIDLNVSSERSNLSRMDADIALRPTHAPPPNLAATRTVELAMAAFGAAGSGPSAGTLEGLAARDHDWIGVMGVLEESPAAQLMDGLVEPGRVVMRVDTFAAMRSLIAAGAGVGLLPCAPTNVAAGLIQLTPPLREHAVPVWVLTHPDVRHSARVKALAQHLADALRAAPDLFGGAR